MLKFSLKKICTFVVFIFCSNSLCSSSNFANADSFNEIVVKVIENIQVGGGYSTNSTTWENFKDSVNLKDGKLLVDFNKARPSFCSEACYLVLLETLKIWDQNSSISKEAWINLKPYVSKNEKYGPQDDGVGCWGRANANGPGFAVLVKELKAGQNIYIANRDRYNDPDEYLNELKKLKTGDFLKIFWNEYIGCDNATKKSERGHLVVFLGIEEKEEQGKNNIYVKYWSSNGCKNDPNGGYGKQTVNVSKICRMVGTRITNPENFNNAIRIKPDDTNYWLKGLDGKFTSSEKCMLEKINTNNISNN